MRGPTTDRVTRGSAKKSAPEVVNAKAQKSAMPEPSSLPSSFAVADATTFYCESRHKPLLRGWLHALTALTSPLWTSYQLRLCRTWDGQASALMSLFSAAWLFSASGAFHTVRWTHRSQEVLLGKLDYVGIFFQVGFSLAPYYVHLLPADVGWKVVAAIGATVASGAFVVLAEPVWARSRHVITSIYICAAALQLLPLCSSAFGGAKSIVSQMLPSEQMLMATTAICYLAGSQCYTFGYPRLWPDVFGYHELWHLLVVIASYCTWSMNCSLLQRT